MSDENGSYDVLVAGAGVAGAAAAVSAARTGAKTALVEKTFVPGGLATLGLITWYPPLDDGKGKQITFGLAEEFLHLGLKYGPGWVYGGWDQPDQPPTGRYSSHFDAACMILALEELLVESGVEIMYDALVVQPVMEGERVAGVEVEDREGRRALSAACVVDATGEAVVAHRAGVPFEEATGQPLAVAVLEASLAGAEKAAERGRGTGVSRRKLTRGRQGEADGGGPYNCNLADDATAFMIETRRMVREHYAAQQAELGEEGRQNLYPVALPGTPQVRKTRHIRGEAALSWSMHGAHAEDSVGLIANWYDSADGEVWAVPYGCLVPQGAECLLAAGRNVSCADPRAWDMLRVIQACVLTGEAAGLGASMAAEKDTTPGALDTADVQARLRRRGVKLHYEPGS